MIKLKKTVLASLTIACLLSLMFLTKCNIPVKASTYIIYVPTDYPTIQEAINNASSGYTIFVQKGIYHENVVVNKSVALIGEDVDLTAEGSGTVIYINASYVSIHGFTIRNSGANPYDSGIYVDHSIGSNISDNKILNTNDGISLYYSSSILISSNVISFNYYSGVVLYSSSNNVIACNILSSNYYGVYLFSSDDNMISDNMVSSNYHGIQLYSSGKNLISGNNVSANLNVGMYITFGSTNNTVYHNNINNMKNLQSDVMNVWDYGGEGNYWNDYKGHDLNGDGIGDTPYVMGALNQDNYPLMGIFSNFSIVLERKIYSVTVISNSTISVFRFEIWTETGNRIIRFNATGEDGAVGFCRVRIPTELMNYPHIVLIDSEEVIPTLLNVSNNAYASLYFTYLQKNHTITIIYSKTLALYFELLDGYLKLQKDLYDLNETYYTLLENYNILLSNYTQLQISFGELNNSYQKLSSLNRTYYELLDNYLKLQMDLHDLNETYHALSGNYNILLYNYSQLQVSFHDLNDSYLKHLLDYSEQMQNIRNLTYILVALTAIFIITTIYLSKRVHARITTKSKEFEGE